MQDRHSRQSQTKEYPPKKDDCKCKENDTATQKLINTERKTYCDLLDTAAADVYKWEENYWGLEELEQKKRCLFIWTEYNYETFRNLEITTGTSLIQFNESIKESTTGFLKSNKALADALKDVVKKAKDLRDKIYALRDAACDLKHCTDEACNAAQWGILTGDWSKCKTEMKDPPKRPPECDNMKDKFEKLFCIPKYLAGDVESVYKGSADVVGIQVFSNIGTLEGLQKTLYDAAKAFDKHLQDTVKKDQDDVKKTQEDFVKTVQDFAKSKATLYSKRSVFVGAFDTAEFFCCPCCDCVTGKVCEERLHDCKEKICDICEEVKETFCGCDTDSSSAS
jgi:hypothetical protein